MIAAAVAGLLAGATLVLCLLAVRDFHREGMRRVRLAEARERAAGERAPVRTSWTLPVGPVNRRHRSWS